MKRINHNSAKKEPFANVKTEIIECKRCPRLVKWREKVATEKVKRFQGDAYWGKPVPSFGDEKAKLLIVGLAPAAHGGNRTGRMFTGDRSGEWLYRALHRAGFANQAASLQLDDGLELIDCYITAVIHCAPPDNKPLPDEINNCRPYLHSEIENLAQVRVVVALGRLAYDTAYSMFEKSGREMNPTGADDDANAQRPVKQRKPKFAHGAESLLNANITLIAAYHPSQQNTFTGRLTEAMLDAVFTRARRILDSGIARRDERVE